MVNFLVNLRYSDGHKRGATDRIRTYDPLINKEMLAKTLDERIVKTHDYLFGGNAKPTDFEITDGLIDCANKLHDIRTKQVELGKKLRFITGDSFGKFDDSYSRIIDDYKWQNLFGNLKTKEEVQAAHDFIKDYIRSAMELKREANLNRLQSMEDVKYKQALDKWEQQVKKTGDETLEKPKRVVVDDNMLDEWLDTEAQRVSTGYTDRSTSALFAPNSDPMGMFKRRAIYDSSLEVDYKGGKFSFDNNLRSYDLEAMVHHSNNRWAGEIAISDFLRKEGNSITFESLLTGEQTVETSLETIRTVIAKECKLKVLKGECTQSEMDKTLRAFDESIHSIRGFGLDKTDNYDCVSDYVADIVKDATFAARGGNLGINQLGDFGNATAYAGMKVLAAVIPKSFGGGKLFKFLLGENADKNMADAIKLMGKDDMTYKMLQLKLFGSRRGRTFGAIGKVLDTTADLVKASGNFTSFVSGLHNLTLRQQQYLQVSFYKDLCEFADGKDTLWTRKASFSVNKLNAIGTNVDEFRNNLKKYLLSDGSLDIDRMCTEDEALYFQCHRYIRNQIQRSMSETTNIGNKNMLANASPKLKVFFLFKNFTLSAINSNAARKLTNRDLDDGLSAMFDIVATYGIRAIAVGAGVWANAAKSDNADSMWNKWKEKICTPSFYAAGLGAGTMSPFTLLVETGATLANTSLYKTTINTRNTDTDKSLLERLVDVASGSAPVDYVRDLDNFVSDTYHYGLTKQNIKKGARLLPNGNSYGIMKVLNLILADTHGVPDRNIRKIR